MKAKERHRQKIIEYIGNPENELCSRSSLSVTVLGFKNERSIYRHFTPDELSEIEKEGIDLRRTKYAVEIGKVDKGLLQKAQAGDPQAAKLVYQRFEGWSEKQEIDSKIDTVIEIKWQG